MIIYWKKLIWNLFISLCVGGLAGIFTKNSMEIFNELNKPPLAPAPSVFPIVWTILYVLMAISAYIITVSYSRPQIKNNALKIYYAQLAVNFFWPLFFFNLNAYLFSFVWLLLLLVLIVIMITKFKKIAPIAAYLQIPYLIWIAFAGYLNIMIYFLNK